MFYNRIAAVSAVALTLSAGIAFADSIDPESFSATLEVGESVTIEKTVVVEATGPTDALIDVHFLIDTSGSMGSEVNNAKIAAKNLFDTLTDTFGDVSASVGVFSEGAYLDDPDPNANVVFGAGLTTDEATFTAEVNNVVLNVPDYGYDFPESGYDAIDLAGGDLDWRDGSSRFMFVFTDASAKGDEAAAAAALAEDDITLVTLAYRSFGLVDGSYGDAGLGGAVYAGGATADDIVSDVTDGITAGFAEYSTVTVDDFGAGLDGGIDVSVVCTGADIGACSGDTAEGDYDRSEDRTFTYDVTFTRTDDGDADFFTYAVVDGGIVARERDTFDGDASAAVPVPAGLPLLLTAIGGLAIARRRRKA